MSESYLQMSNPLETEDKKRKIDEIEDDSPAQKSGIGAAVASHYNNLKTTIETRNESRILHLRNFNNFVKSFLINKFSRQVKQELTNNGKFGAIDLGCGKGGDMFKWDKAGISQLVCVDIAKDSVATCKDRYDRLRPQRNGCKFRAQFIVADCTKVCFQALLADPTLKVELVSCQFAFHYCFESLSQALTMVKNASSNLKKGGVFVLTMPDSNYIIKKVLESPDKKSFKNEVFSITFPEPLEFAGYDKSSTQDADKPSTQENNESSTQENDESSTQESDKSSTKECDSPINSEDPLSSSNPGDSLPSNNSKEAVPDPNHPLFGHMYHFYLDGVVDCPEFLVHQETLKTLCSRFGLECVYQKRFREVFREALDDSSMAGLVHKMGGRGGSGALEMFPAAYQSSAEPAEYQSAREYVDTHGQSEKVFTLSRSEWEAADLYTAMAFKKV